MKKSILIISAVCAAAAFLGGCQSCDSATTNQYDELNEMLEAGYSSLKIAVIDNYDGDTFLESVYEIEYTANGANIDYSVERFTQISVTPDGNAIKTKLIGKASVTDGKVTYISGDRVEIPENLTESGINFKQDYFDNVEMTGISFTASVNDLSGFLGVQTSGTDAQVFATFLEVFYEIEITYKAESGNSVEIKYVFDI